MTFIPVTPLYLPLETGYTPHQYTGYMATYPESTLIFENPEFTVRALSVSDMDNSVYLITIRHTGEQMLIDPAYDAEALYTFTLEAIMQDCPNLALTEENDRRVRILESEEDFEPIPRHALGVTGIMVTHGHWDHIRALRELESLTGAITYAGSADAEAIRALENFTVEIE